eukprot:g5831.t1
MLPASLRADALISLSVLEAGGVTATHTRRLERAPPPPQGGGSGGGGGGGSSTGVHTSTFQVDHETKALRKDGVRFIMSGWFAGGYGFENAGLPPSLPPPSSPASSSAASLEEASVLGQASLVTEFGRQGHTFVRAGGWSNLTEATQYLDAAASAGLSVLWNVGADRLARAMAGILDKKTGLPVGDPKELWAETAGNVTAIKDHPAIGGYYACDDCCHMDVLDEYGPVEYENLAVVRERIAQLDPYHLMFGTVACGETWYWSEEAAGLGIDVIMKEGYGGGIGSDPIYRRFPETFEPLVLMPDPASLSNVHSLLSHSYAGAIGGGDMFHTNFFVLNNDQFRDWRLQMGVSLWATETTELLPSYTSRAPQHVTVEVTTSEHAAVYDTLEASSSSSTSSNAGGGNSVTARVYTEETPPDQPAGAYFCHHLIAVNAAPLPVAAQFAVSGLVVPPNPASSSSSSSSPPPLTATRLFGGPYTLNLTQGDDRSSSGGGSSSSSPLIMRDFINARSTNVYRIGCNMVAADSSSSVIGDGSSSSSSSAPQQNYIIGGDVEAPVAVDPSRPGYLNDIRGALGSLGSCGRGGDSGDSGPDWRCRVTASTADPHGGRYAAQVNTGSDRPVAIALPVNSSLPLNSSDAFELTAWALSAAGLRVVRYDPSIKGQLENSESGKHVPMSLYAAVLRGEGQKGWD